MAIDDPLSEAAKATVKKQVEFYFSDSNVARDKFLMEKILSHPEGYVELAVLCSFARMTKALQIPAGQSSEEIPNAIVAKVAGALEDSETLQLSEDKQFVKRKAPLVSRDVVIKEMDERSIYAKPLPFDTTLDRLTEFFSALGKVGAVRMRRHLESKDFKGSVFVEFDSPATANMVAARENIEFEGAVLRIEMKSDYTGRKKRERIEAAANGQRAQVPAPTPAQDPASAASPMEASPSPAKAEPAETTAAPTPIFQLGTVLQFKFNEGQDLSTLYYREIKTSMGGREGGVTFVEYSKGSDFGFVRYKEASAAEKMLADSAGGLKIQDLDATLEKVDEEAEKEFHNKALLAIQNAEKQKLPGGGNFHVDNKRKALNQRGRGRGGRFGKRGRMN